MAITILIKDLMLYRCHAVPSVSVRGYAHKHEVNNVLLCSAAQLLFWSMVGILMSIWVNGHYYPVDEAGNESLVIMQVMCNDCGDCLW